MISHVHHVGYLVRDLDAAVDWYVKNFGGKLFKVGETATGKIAFVTLGDGEVELIQPADAADVDPSGAYHHVGYIVEDLDGAVAELKGKGFKFASEEPQTNAAGYRLIFLDTSSTNGLRIHLTDGESIRKSRAGS